MKKRWKKYFVRLSKKLYPKESLNIISQNEELIDLVNEE